MATPVFRLDAVVGYVKDDCACNYVVVGVPVAHKAIGDTEFFTE